MKSVAAEGERIWLREAETLLLLQRGKFLSAERERDHTKRIISIIFFSPKIIVFE